MLIDWIDCSDIFFLPSFLLYSQLCWFWRRWTGQAWDVRINTTWWPLILHTYDRRVTTENLKETGKADDNRKIVQAAHILLSCRGEFETQDAKAFFLGFLGDGRKLLKSPALHQCTFTHISCAITNNFIRSQFLAFWLFFLMTFIFIVECVVKLKCWSYMQIIEVQKNFKKK